MRCAGTFKVHRSERNKESASKILDICETRPENTKVCSAKILKNYIREAATEMCGK